MLRPSHTFHELAMAAYVRPYLADVRGCGVIAEKAVQKGLNPSYQALRFIRGRCPNASRFPKTPTSHDRVLVIARNTRA